MMLALPAAGLSQEREAGTPATQPSSLGATQLAALRAIQPEPQTSKLIFNQHYVVSNELRQYLFKLSTRGSGPRGGLFVGVGAEQNYLLAAWYHSDVLVVVDFDPWIADLHNIYAVLFRRAKTPQEFLRLWSEPARREVEAAIAIESVSADMRQQRVRVFRYARDKVQRRLLEIAKDYPLAGVDTFLSSREQYDHLAALARSGRMHALQADFSGERTLKQLAEWSRRSRVPLRVLYLSNIEWYFPYAQGRYRQNILDFNFGEPSLVLQTSPMNRKRYAYVFQTGATYREWLRCQCVPSLKHLLRHASWVNEQVIEVRKRPADVEGLPRTTSQ